VAAAHASSTLYSSQLAYARARPSASDILGSIVDAVTDIASMFGGFMRPLFGDPPTPELEHRSPRDDDRRRRRRNHPYELTSSRDMAPYRYNNGDGPRRTIYEFDPFSPNGFRERRPRRSERDGGPVAQPRSRSRQHEQQYSSNSNKQYHSSRRRHSAFDDAVGDFQRDLEDTIGSSVFGSRRRSSTTAFRRDDGFARRYDDRRRSSFDAHTVKSVVLSEARKVLNGSDAVKELFGGTSVATGRPYWYDVKTHEVNGQVIERIEMEFPVVGPRHPAGVARLSYSSQQGIERLEVTASGRTVRPTLPMKVIDAEIVDKKVAYA